jgi:catechol 2,3-dioxygenase-like lactoylglutathione lyase family enzyme
MSTVSATGIREISLVILPVTDQDVSIEFYEKLGLEKRTDLPFGGGQLRWVEVYAPIGSTGIALAPPPGGKAVEPQPTGITLQTADVDSTHAELKARGVDVDEEIMRGGGDGVPQMFWLRDPDGHSLIVVQPAA